MDVLFWIIDLLIPGIMITIGMLWKNRPPKKINIIYGYRSSRSMASQEAWDMAHELAGAVWRKLGIALLVLVVVVKLVIPLAPEYLSIINMCVGLAGIIAPIPYVEKQLKKEFS